VGYFEYDVEGRIIDVNRTELELLGYRLDEMIGQPVWKFIVEGEAARQQILQKLTGTLPPAQGLERTYRRKDGTTFPVLVGDRILQDSEGKIIGIRTTIQDITGRKRAEEEMRGLEEQFRQSQKMEAVGRLGGGIAHDFNNLLTIIKGYSQLSLLDLKENDPLWGNIQEIQKATQRATDLTRQLLAFSRRQILDLKVLDLNTLLKDLDKMLRRIIGEDIELTTLLAENLGRVKIDPGQFEQMILNLAVNARDAIPSGGKLTIETANVVLDEEYARTHVSVTPGPYVRLSVSDTGVGIPLEVKEKVFEPFFTTKEKGKGTGLGLSTVYGIVKQSGGNIWVYSEPAYGTTFKIYLPRVEEDLDTLYGQDETDFLPRGSETVLLVEDEPSVRDLAHRLLSQQGYRVLEATDGKEALHVVQEHIGEKIHLLLTDVVMPQMGGKELADQLKLLRPDIKVLYTSGYTDDAIVHHGVLEPGTHFLQKPFSPKTLSHKMREVLDR
jgi:PAS domain S-box-containing protein